MSGLANRFYLSFVYQDRWRFFLDGFWMTLLLTLVSFILGSVMGILLCTLKRSSCIPLRKTVNALISFLVQLPTLVLLMLFAYVVFGTTPLSVTLIVLFGLILKAGAYLSNIFFTAVGCVSIGEVEAAQTLGLTKLQVFRHILLPQAVSAALPVYKNQFIITMQETSVVGYLAISDLTRASDVVTSRTYDPFIGLLVISIVYILIGYFGKRGLGLLEIKTHLGDSVLR